MGLTNFDYQITNLKKKGKKNVKVTFDYQDYKVTYEFSLKHNDKFNENDYLNEAKKQIENEIDNGKLVKYADKYLKKHSVKLPLFSDFQYSLVPSSLNGYKEVQVILTYQNQRVTTYTFIKKEKNKDNEYYLNEAKKKISKNIKNGNLLKDVKAILNPKKGIGASKVTKIALASIGVAALTFGGLFLYYYINGNGVGGGGGDTPVVDDKLSITVDPNGGTFTDSAESGIKIFKVEPNSTWSELGISVTAPSGKTQDGWDYSAIGGAGWNHITASGDITFTANTTVKAKYNGQTSSHTVTYNLCYDGLVDKRLVEDGQKAPKPGTPDFPAPVRENYTLDDNWYTDTTYATSFNFDTPITGDTEIFAKWNPVSETVAINPNGGTFNDDTTGTKNLSISYGTTWADVKSAHSEITIKTNPVGTRTGYTYEYYDVVEGEWKILEDTFVIKGNLSVRVAYSYLEATIKFADDYQGATMPNDKVIKYGTKWVDIKNECKPTSVKTGYKFDHYYIVNGTDQIPVDDDYVFNITTEDDITLHACYEVTITFVNEPAKGTIDSKMEALTGEKWGDIKIEPVSIDPYQFDKFTNSDGGDVTDNDIIRGPDTFTAVYIESTGEADDFQLDPWPVFLNEINKYNTIEELGAEGNPYHDEYMESTQFISAQRQITFGGHTYTVRVVDQHDRDESTDGSLFTFEFTETLYPDLIYNKTGDGNGFADSALYTYLNVDFYYIFPEEVKNDIKDKSVKYYNDAAGEVQTTSAKLYPLSASEMGYEFYPETQGGDVEEVKDEGEALDYYAGTFVQPSDIIRKKERVEETGSQNYVNYWLRSADINNPESVWLVNGEAGLGKLDSELGVYTSEYYDHALAVAPAFEI